MICRTCRCHIEPELDFRSLLTVIAFALLIGFVGGIFFTDWKLVPRFEQKIEEDRVIKEALKEELGKGTYIPRLEKKEVIKK